MGWEVTATKVIGFAFLVIAILLFGWHWRGRLSRLAAEQEDEYYRRFESRSEARHHKLQMQFDDVWCRLNALEMGQREIQPAVDKMLRMLQAGAGNVSPSLDRSRPSPPVSIEFAHRADAVSAAAALPPLRREISKAEAHKIIRQFIELCDEGFFDFAKAVDWFGRELPTARLEAVGQSSPEDWALISVDVGSKRLVIPAIRRPMGDVPLERHFELQNYNGIDALRASFVIEIPEWEYQMGDWVLARKGRIHAH